VSKIDAVAVFVRSDGSPNLAPDRFWSSIHEAFKGYLENNTDLPNLDLNPIDTISFSTGRVYIAEVTTPEQGNAKNVDLSGIDHALQAIKILESIKAGNQYDYSVIFNWFQSGVDNTHGCPISPPYPVEEVDGRGRYKIALPQLPVNLQKRQGKV